MFMICEISWHNSFVSESIVHIFSIWYSITAKQTHTEKTEMQVATTLRNDGTAKNAGGFHYMYTRNLSNEERERERERKKTWIWIAVKYSTMPFLHKRQDHRQRFTSKMVNYVSP